APVARVENHQGARGSVNLVRELAQRAVDEVVDLEARGRGAAVLDFQLLDGLDVVGLADRVPRSPRVLGKEREVSPDVPYQFSGRVKLGRKYVGDGREYFGREGAILVLAVLGDIIRVAAHPVFP